MIDLDTMPPDWNFAHQHAKASKPGLVQNIHTQKTINVFCPCCLKPIVKKEIPLFENSKELEFLGFGFPLYFIFIKYCIVLILVLIVTYSGISLFWGIQNTLQFCAHRRLSSEADVQCTSFMIMFARIQHTVSAEDEILRISSFIAHLLALVYIRDSIRKTIEYYDEKTTSLSDYSVIIRNLPLKDGIQQNIINFIHNHFKQKWSELKDTYNMSWVSQQQKAMQITLLPYIKDYYNLVHEKRNLNEKKRNILMKMDLFQSASFQKTGQQNALEKQLALIQDQINKQNTKIHQKCQNYRLLNAQDQLQTQKAIVILNSELYKNIILEEQQNIKLDSKLLGQYFGDFEGQIKIEEAPQPSEIIWSNIDFSKKQRHCGKLIGWGLSLFFIAVITIGYYFLVVLKTQNLIDAIQHSPTVSEYHSNNHYKIAVFLVYLFLFCIILFNKLILGLVLNYFTYFEKHENSSDEQFSFAIKYTIGMFFTTALMTLAVQDITFHNFYTHEYGVIEQETIMFFMNAFFVPIIWLVNPWQLYMIIVRKIKYGKNYVTQIQANIIMSDPPYKMGKRYAQIIQTMWFTFLYATLIPVGAFITLAGLSIYYWIDKYNLLRRSSWRSNISGKMAIISLKLLDFTLILRPLGTILFDSEIRDGVHITSIVFLAIGFAYLLIPINSILSCLHGQRFKQEEKSYEEVKDTFLQTYETLNPILSFKVNQVFQRLQNKVGKRISLGKIEQAHLFLNNKPSIHRTNNYNSVENSLKSFQIMIRLPEKSGKYSDCDNNQKSLDTNSTQVDLLQKNS